MPPEFECNREVVLPASPEQVWEAVATTAGNAASIIAAGADGVAVISALLLAGDPAQAARDLRAIVDGATAKRSYR